MRKKRMENHLKSMQKAATTARIVQLYQQGIGLKGIGRRVGLSPSTVKRHLQEAGAYKGVSRLNTNGTVKKVNPAPFSFTVADTPVVSMVEADPPPPPAERMVPLREVFERACFLCRDKSNPPAEQVSEFHWRHVLRNMPGYFYAEACRASAFRAHFDEENV
jgi:hypothetical protein